jgi:hypothetical protein
MNKMDEYRHLCKKGDFSIAAGKTSYASVLLSYASNQKFLALFQRLATLGESSLSEAWAG